MHAGLAESCADKCLATGGDGVRLGWGLIYSICPFLWCKCASQATREIPLTSELGLRSQYEPARHMCFLEVLSRQADVGMSLASLLVVYLGENCFPSQASSLKWAGQSVPHRQDVAAVAGTQLLGGTEF